MITELWNCDICSISMSWGNQSSDLAGNPHATRAEEILAITRENRTEKRIDPSPTYLKRAAEYSNVSVNIRPFPPKSTLASHNQPTSSSSALMVGSATATLQRCSTDRARTRERGTETSDRPTTEQENLTFPLLANATAGVFPMLELTIEEIAKPADFVSAYGGTYVLVWECKPCNRWMPLSSKAAHLVSTVHAKRLLYAFMVSPPAAAQDQSDTGAQLPIYNMGVMQTSGYTKPNAGVHERKPKSAESRQSSDITRALGRQIKEAKTKVMSSGARSTPGPPATPSWTCPHCRVELVAYQTAAHQCVHLESRIVKTKAPKYGAIDRFFFSFPSFLYDAQKSPDVSFGQLMAGLRMWHTWDKKNPATRKLYRRQVLEDYQSALTHEFNLWFGTSDNIESWHALCRAVRIQPLPPSCQDCREAIQGTHVNIVDLINWARKGETGRVEIFPTVKQLSDYSYGNGKIYHRDQLEAGAVLNFLLRELRKARHERVRFT